MARDYGKISTTIWNSRKFGALGPNDDARLLYFYLHTCPHVNSLGCFVLPVGYAATDLRWSETRCLQALDSLSAVSLIGWTPSEQVVRIVDFLKFDPFTNPDHAKGAVKLALRLPDCDQKALLIKEVMTCRHVRDKTVLMQTLDSLSTGCRHPEPEPEPEPDPEPKIVGRGGSAGARDEPPPATTDEGVYTPTFRERILEAIGVGPDGIVGPNGKVIGTAADVQIATRWRDELGLTEADIVAVVSETMAAKTDGLPTAFKYFNLPMQRLAKAKTEPLPEPSTSSSKPGSRRHGRSAFNSAINATADRLSAGTAHLDTSSRDPFTR
jgi:hypothetical protein